MFTPRYSFLLLGVLTSVLILVKNPSRNASARVREDVPENTHENLLGPYIFIFLLYGILTHASPPPIAHSMNFVPA